MVASAPVAGDGDGRHHALAWVLFGTLFALVGLVMTLAGLAALTEPDDISGLPACSGDFGDDCLTDRAGVLDDSRYRRGSWFSREQSWSVDVPAGAPWLDDGEKLEVDLPRQPGRNQLRPGLEVNLVFYEDRAALVELPSGAALETDEHRVATHRRSATSGCSGWAADRSPRGRESAPGAEAVLAQDPRRLQALGPGLVLGLAGMFGALAQTVAGGARWVGLAGALVGAGLGGWAVVRSRRRAR